MCAGAVLLDLPTEVLQSIASKFDADKWAKGPSITCQRLYQMPLTRLDLCMEGPAPFSATQKIVSGLTWAAKRAGAATTSVAISLLLYGACAGSTANNPLVAAFSEVAQLCNLRSLDCSAWSFEDSSECVLVGFLDWLLDHAPKLETLFTQSKTQRVPASHVTFQHMRHLSMSSNGFQRHFLVAEQLPVLEIFCIYGSCNSGLEVIDMSGCMRIRQLLFSEFVMQQLIWDATDANPCPLAFELRNSFKGFAERSPDALTNQAALAQQVILWSHDDFDGYVKGMLGSFPQIKTLVLDLPSSFGSGWAGEDDISEDAGGFLTWCMPADQQPLLHLQTIIIKAPSTDVRFPSAKQLPNLRELAVMASGCLELQFQDPVGTIARLSNLHVFGRPFDPHGPDMMKLMAASRALEERGLVLGAAATEQHGPHKRPTSCLYLRPIGARERQLMSCALKLKSSHNAGVEPALSVWKGTAT